MPDLSRRQDETQGRNRPDRRVVAGWRVAREPPRRPGDRPSVSLLLWRRRIVRFRSPQILRAWRIRRTARPVLSRGHGPRISGVETRVEGVLSARERRPPRTSRHYRQALLDRLYPVCAAKEFPPLFLEEHPRVGPADLSFLLRFCGRHRDRVVGKFADAH